MLISDVKFFEDLLDFGVSLKWPFKDLQFWHFCVLPLFYSPK